MDKSSKIILAVIAAGLWANVAAIVVSPAPASATDFPTMQYQIDGIYYGHCHNSKIC